MPEAFVANPATGCRCGSGAHPRRCDLHPELYRLHVAELNVEAHLPEDSADATAAMAELNDATAAALRAARDQVVQQLQDEIRRLHKLVFQTVPMKRGGIGRLWAKPAPGFGGATDYEAWLRTLEHQDLQHLIKLHTGAIDSLRYRRRFVQHEAERRYLHSSYGRHQFEHMAELSRGTS